MSVAVKPLPYLPQLDSFRFFAVLLVIFSHWLGGTLINIIPNGFLGVTFFFVLSGFLISSNLLFTKKRLDINLVSFWRAIKTFYIRRTLRIFPLYFIVIFLILILNASIFNGYFLWYVSYIPNFLIYKLQKWPGMLSHFWSLGVEEQFYFIWPFLIFLFPRKYLKYLFLSVILFSILFKIFFFIPRGSFFNFYDILPFSCFDAFGIGALLALFMMGDNKFQLLFIAQFPAWIVLLFLALFAFVIYISGLSFLFGLTISLGSFYLILKVITGYKGFFAFVMNNSVIQFLGKISYGLYVYHNFVPWILRCITGRETSYPLSLPVLRAEWLHGALLVFMVQFLLLLIIASGSWFLIEKPINGLKRYFV